jgi:predicted Zn-dependent protease
MDEVESYRQILMKNPGSPVFVDLAEALFKQNRYGEAIETCENGLHLHPHDLRGRVILGLSYLRTDDLDRAKSALLKASELLEINAVTYEGLAELYERRGETNRSAQYRKVYEALRSWEPVAPPRLERVAEVEPKVEAFNEAEVATVTMAELYAKQGHLDKAAAVYRRILEASPGVAAVEERLAELEGGSKAAQPGTRLIAVLEELRDNLMKRSRTGSTEISNQGEIVDPNKLAALIRKLAQE